MISSVFLAGLVAAAGLAGCAKEYRHQALGKDSPQARQIGEMIASLRSAGPGELEAVIARQSASGLTGPQTDALRASLGRISAAEAVELADLSLFGERVYRAVLDVRSGGATEQVCMLLVATDQGLRWAGPN